MSKKKITKEEMFQQSMAPIMDAYQQGVEALMLAYMAESGLTLKQIKPVTVQDGNIIRTYVTRREGV